LSKKEYYLTEKGLTEGRPLNGDEKNNLILGPQLSIQKLSLYLR
jgi:hypothetical protein